MNNYGSFQHRAVCGQSSVREQSRMTLDVMPFGGVSPGEEADSPGLRVGPVPVFCERSTKK